MVSFQRISVNALTHALHPCACVSCQVLLARHSLVGGGAISDCVEAQKKTRPGANGAASASRTILSRLPNAAKNLRGDCICILHRFFGDAPAKAGLCRSVLFGNMCSVMRPAPNTVRVASPGAPT